jgi:hypothetical protein
MYASEQEVRSEPRISPCLGQFWECDTGQSAGPCESLH